MLKFLRGENKGITLVALVITIIILLLLTGITITQLTNKGLFDNARLAKKKYEHTKAEEDIILDDYKNTISKYIDGNRNEILFKYSTEETKIGTWVDGKDLYRKIVKSTISGGTTQDIPHEISNIDFAIIEHAYLVSKEEGRYYSILIDNHFSLCWVDENYITIEKNSGSNHRGYEVYFILNYTKK